MLTSLLSTLSLSLKTLRRKCRFSFALLGLFAPAARVAAQGPPAPNALAVFNGQPVLEDQLPSELLSQLRRMEQQIYLVRLRGLHEIIDRQLVAAEASRQKLAPQALVKSRIAAVPEPTEQQVKAYYDEHKTAINQPFEEAAPGIRLLLKNTALQDAGRSYTQNLFQDAVNNKQLLILLRPPTVEVEPDPARLQGSANAPVTIVEFSDFSCPYCSRANAALGDLLARHPGQVRVSYRDFPLITLHPNAAAAAEASRCAGEQNKYWPFHDILFAHIGNQAHDDLVRYAQELDLDAPRFKECLNSGRYRVAVEKDRQLGIRSGVMATPSFFVNGIFLDGVQTTEDFEAAIQRTQAMHTGNPPEAISPSISKTGSRQPF